MSTPAKSSVNVQSCNFSQPGQAPGRLTWCSVVLHGSSCAKHRDTHIDTTDRETCDNVRHVIIIKPRHLNAACCCRCRTFCHLWVCRTRRWALLKRLNRSKCRLPGRLMRPKNDVRWRVHIRATWRIRLSDTCAAEMRHYVKLLWPLVWLVSLPSLPAVQLLKFKQHQLVCFSDNYVIIITFKALFITRQIHRVIVTPLTDLLFFGFVYLYFTAFYLSSFCSQHSGSVDYTATYYA